MTAADNPYFARAAVNRLWDYFFGSPLAEQAKGAGDEAPAAHKELLDALAREFVAHGYDVKFLIRAITASQAYQRTSAVSHPSHKDARRFARRTAPDFICQPPSLPSQYLGFSHFGPRTSAPPREARMNGPPPNDQTLDLTTPPTDVPRPDDEHPTHSVGPGGAGTESEQTLPGEGAVPRPEDMTMALRPAPEGGTVEYVSREAHDPDATLARPPGGAATQGAADFLLKETAGEAAGGGPTVAGYEILGVLGRGGMGVVYRARQKKLNRIVALKMVLAGAHASPLQLARFHTEAQAVAQFQHPNIVQIYEVGEHDGLPFFSLEFIDGDSLAKRIAGTPRPPREAARTVELLAHGMAAAHARGIIHRDLKPANVLLTADGTPKITDFGLAKRLEDDSSQTKSGTLLGTPSYMSPEQARGDTQDVGPLSDLYALGAILYELLTGRPPFVGATMLETILQVRSDEPVPPTRLNPKVPRDLETICLKCLQKEPHKRYADCEALAEDLHRFLAGLPIHARPVGWAGRLWRWCRRNPRVAALSAAVAVLLVAVVAGLAVLGVRQGRERQAVAEARRVAGERLEQAGAVIAAGDYQRAQDLLSWSDPLLASHPGLADVRADHDTLQAQVEVYAEFKQLLDKARFACFYGSRQEKQQGRETCRRLLELYGAVEQKTGRAAAGLPPLNAEQEQLFKEDVFEMFLIAALVERELAADGDEAKKKAARQAIDWLNRAEKVLPGTRALYAHRCEFWGLLGDREADKADKERALKIKPTSAVDHFWHGYAHHLRGHEARRRKDAKAARDFYHQEVAEYAALLRLRPDHFWGYFNWAVCQAQLGEAHDLHDDLVRFTACIRLRPDLPWPYNNRGTIHLNLKEHDLAVTDFTAALARNDQYAEAHANRGLALAAQGKDDAALEDFGKAIALNPDYAPARAERVKIFVKRKQYAEAVRDQDRLVALNPKDLPARATRAELCIAAGDYLKARDDLTQILAAAPKAAPVWRARAVLNWQKLKDFDAAIKDFEQFAQLAPKDPEPHRCIGAILLGRRQYDRAEEALRKAVALRPGYAEALWGLAQIDLWRNRPEEALKRLDPLVAKLPAGPPETLNVRGDVYRAMGRLDDAAADYRRMIELKPKEPDAYVSLAGICERQGKLQLTRDCYERLVKAAPESARSYLCRAEFRRAQKEYGAALADCDQAAMREPASPLPALVRAGIEASRGRPEIATADAERALARAPKDDGQALYAAARAWSLAAGAETDAARAAQDSKRAAALLAQVFDRGFHDLNYPQHNRMADDPALAAVRQVPGVRDLLAHRPAGK